MYIYMYTQVWSISLLMNLPVIYDINHVVYKLCCLEIALSVQPADKKKKQEKQQIHKCKKLLND